MSAQSASGAAGASGPAWTVVLVGAGPRGVGLAERIAADAGRVELPGGGLDLHLVDPFPPGGGRVWRADQPDELWLNSRAVDVTFYADESVVMDGVRRSGPTFWEWVAAGGAGGPDGQPPSADVDAAGRAEPGAFLPRTSFTAYLDDLLATVRAELPTGTRLTVHTDTVLDVRDTAGGDSPQEVLLGSGGVLAADVVVLCQGHAPVRPEPGLQRFADAATAHGLTWIAPGYGADIDLTPLGAGEPVLVRGLGLGFLDEVVALTEGRGGRYERLADGGLRYHPSAREPVLFVGSRRGVPYHCKPVMELGAPRAALPRYATPAAAAALRSALGRPLELHDDVWPLVAKDLAFAWYHELCHAHPERTTQTWEEFTASLDTMVWDSPELLDAVAAGVPDPADRFDPVRLDRPAGGRSFAGLTDFNTWARQHVRADISRRTTDENSMELALYWALLVMFGTLAAMTATGIFSVTSRLRDIEGRYFSFLSAIASGPPRLRLEQLVALGDAGVLTLLGPHTRFDVDESAGMFTACSPAVGETVRARALLEARLPGPTVVRSEDPLTRALLARGEISEQVLTDGTATLSTGRVATRQPDQRLLLADGTPHPRRFAVGAWTEGGRASAGLPRPGFNAGFFRQNDTVALAVLDLLAARADPSGGHGSARAVEDPGGREPTPQNADVAV
jgi:hypothetical protein